MGHRDHHDFGSASSYLCYICICHVSLSDKGKICLILIAAGHPFPLSSFYSYIGCLKFWYTSEWLWEWGGAIIYLWTKYSPINLTVLGPGSKRQEKFQQDKWRSKVIPLPLKERVNNTYLRKCKSNLNMMYFGESFQRVSSIMLLWCTRTVLPLSVSILPSFSL